MAAQEFQQLFSPLKIHNVTIPNRVVFSAHVPLYWPPHQAPNDRAMQYFLARARGGVGLIILGQNVVRSVSTAGGFVAVQNDRALPDFEAFCTAIHDQGTKVFAQLGHTGPRTDGTRTGGTGFAPSPLQFPGGLLPSEYTIPIEMDIEHIQEVVQAYAAGAKRMQNVGFDGVEISSTVGAGMLLVSFLSPLSNRRTMAKEGQRRPV